MSGNSNRPLAEAVSKRLNQSLAPGYVKKFADGEIAVGFDQNLNGKHCYIV